MVRPLRGGCQSQRKCRLLGLGARLRRHVNVRACFCMVPCRSDAGGNRPVEEKGENFRIVTTGKWPPWKWVLASSVYFLNA